MVAWINKEVLAKLKQKKETLAEHAEMLLGKPKPLCN